MGARGAFWRLVPAAAPCLEPGSANGNVDIGDLIDSNKPLFLLSHTDPLRVYVNVPQAYANLVRPGQPAVVTQAEMRGRSYTGQVARTAGSIDAATRTMQAEINLRNADGALLPGAFVQVALPLPASASLVIPANALMFRSDGLRVAVVDGNGKVQLRAVQVGRNLGQSVEVLEGVTTADRLIFSTDSPFQRPTREDVDRFLTAFPTDEDREGFTTGNARALFGIPVD